MKTGGGGGGGGGGGAFQAGVEVCLGSPGADGDGVRGAPEDVRVYVRPERFEVRREVALTEAHSWV